MTERAIKSPMVLVPNIWRANVAALPIAVVIRAIAAENAIIAVVARFSVRVSVGI